MRCTGFIFSSPTLISSPELLGSISNLVSSSCLSPCSAISHAPAIVCYLCFIKPLFIFLFCRVTPIMVRKSFYLFNMTMSRVGIGQLIFMEKRIRKEMKKKLVLPSNLLYQQSLKMMHKWISARAFFKFSANFSTLSLRLKAFITASLERTDNILVFCGNVGSNGAILGEDKRSVNHAKVWYEA